MDVSDRRRIAVAAKGVHGDCPFVRFVRGETDAGVRAKVLSKVDYLTQLEPSEYSRPLVDTLRGQIKEVRFGKGLRLLFSVECSGQVLLLYGGERKKKNQCSPQLIDEATWLRRAWLSGTSGEAIDVLAIRRGIKRKRMG